MEPLPVPGPLDPASTTPLHRQLYERLRDAILAGRLPPGGRLQSSRGLEGQLGVSRNTVLSAFDQLAAEGYLEGRRGSGTYVSRSLPEDALTARPAEPPRPAGGASARLSARGAALAATVPWDMTGAWPARPFAALPELARFPFRAWSALVAQAWRVPAPELTSYGAAAGHRPLREVIAAHLEGTRGVRCEPEQVIVVGGSQQALFLAAHVLLDPGDRTWIEDPGYVGARTALTAAGARLVPVPVDAEGLDVGASIRRCPDARLAYVTPAHQCPLGVTMSLSRRLALIEWARQADAWVVEDDYDSEFRYAGRPLAALQGLDPDRVVYTGTFSKVLFPGLRLGHLVVPLRLAAAFTKAKAAMDRHTPALEQAVLARFVAGGHLSSHVRRMRQLYRARQAAALRAGRRLRGRLDLGPAPAGMYLLGRLPAEADDLAVAGACFERGVVVAPLSHFTIEHRQPPGLLLGYTAFDEAEIAEGVERLAGVLEEVL